MKKLFIGMSEDAARPSVWLAYLYTLKFQHCHII